MTFPELLLSNLAIVATVFTALWLVSLWVRDASIVDIAWGPSFVVVCWASLLLTGQSNPQSVAIVTLVSIWGIRLCVYLAWRNLGKGEDFRYRSMRDKHGAWFSAISLCSVFLLQAGIVWVVSLPIQAGVALSGELSWLAYLGMLVYALGLTFEAVGDYQLARFKADPTNRGRVMNQGLWRYTRHPNYFGDFLVWWGIYLVACEPSTWWWTVVGPLIMSALLIWVSGVRHLEGSLASRINGYKAYVERTSPFFPLPPK